MKHLPLSRLLPVLPCLLLSPLALAEWYPREAANFTAAYTRGSDVAESNPSNPLFPYNLVAVDVGAGIRPYLVNDRGTVVFHWGDPGTSAGYGRKRFGERDEPLLGNGIYPTCLNNRDAVAGIITEPRTRYTRAAIWPADGVSPVEVLDRINTLPGGFEESWAYALDDAGRALCLREYRQVLAPRLTAIQVIEEGGYMEQDYLRMVDETVYASPGSEPLPVARYDLLYRECATAAFEPTTVYDPGLGIYVPGPLQPRIYRRTELTPDSGGGVIVPFSVGPDYAIAGYSYGDENWPFQSIHLFSPQGPVLDLPFMPFVESHLNDRGYFLAMHRTGQSYFSDTFPLTLWNGYGDGSQLDLGTSQNVYAPNVPYPPAGGNLGLSNPREDGEPMAIINGPDLHLEMPVDPRVDTPFQQYEFEDLLAGGPWRNFTATCMSPSGEVIAGVALDAFNAPHGVVLLRGGLYPDLNRDRMIDESDRILARSGQPWRFWTNCDDDDGDEARSSEDDLPRPSSALSGADAADARVDGIRDLVDFFPVLLDLEQLRGFVADPGSLGIRLRHAGKALNIVCTGYAGHDLGDYLTELPRDDFGASGDQSVEETEVIHLSNQWTELDPQWIAAASTRGAAVWLVEASSPTSQPLEVQITLDGDTLAEMTLPLSISHPAEMFRWLNLRAAVGGQADEPSRMQSPANWPDIETNGRIFVSLHGYNATEDDARSHHAEMFKRLFWSGFNGRYVGVAWRGEESYLPLLDFTPDYYENVTNAFKSALPLTAALSALGGFVDVIAAHSLGNVVVNSALTDAGLRVGRYFALNGAVPVEAFRDGSLNIEQMRNEEWSDYDQRLWAAFWHRLFIGYDDPRASLTWRGRFENAVDVLYNFYSSGEDVLANASGSTPTITGPLIDSLVGRKGVGIWYTQEMWKGTNLALMMAGDGHGGWGFNTEDWSRTVQDNRGHHVIVPPPPSDATEEKIESYRLVTAPFFRKFQEADTDEVVQYNGNGLFASFCNGSLGSTEQEQFDTRAKLLAEAIPALSFAMGSNVVGVEKRNFDMDTGRFKEPGMWPQKREREYWRHSDLLRPAYAFNFKLYDTLVTEGKMK